MVQCRRPFLLLHLSAVAALAAACSRERYVSKVRPETGPPLASYEGETTELDALLDETKLDAEAGGLLAGMDESIAIVLDGQVAYTVVIKDGKATIRKGLTSGSAPTLTVPVVREALRNLREAVADRKLDDAEIFNVAYVLFIPCLKRIHGMFYFTESGDTSALKVDNFMHFRLKNPSGFTYHGEKVDIAATVLNVDGFFFYQPKLVGDPDVRYEFSIDEALELYRLLVYEAERARNDNLALVELGRRVEPMLERAQTYKRSWH